MSGMSLPLIFIFILISLFTKTALGFHPGTGAENIQCMERERHALLTFKKGLIDDYNHLSSWGIDEDCCKWRGVRCSNRTGHVLGLNLHVSYKLSNGGYTPLRGNISSSLLELQYLNYLDLSLNDFEQIPDFIGSLKNLLHLNLSGAFFGGKVPYQLGNLSKLQSLDLNYNYPMYAYKLEWLSHLSSLRQLRLNWINLSEAFDWLQVVSELRSLTVLQLQLCSLPSVISSPISLVNSSKTLTHLDLSLNRLPNSSIYPWLSNLGSSLVDLDLSGNNLQGPVPYYAFSNMTSLLHLDLSDNQIVGPLKSFGNLCSLKTLSLSNNNLTGNLVLSSCSKDTLETLLLFNNFLSGSIPDLSVFVSLKELRIRGNLLNGTLPKSIGKLSMLEVLDVSSNPLEGTVTEAYLSNLSRLSYLDLSSNSLTLNFKDNWVPPFQLDTILMRDCQVGPRFPKWLQNQHNFSELDISNARISDTIPDWFWDLSPNLSILNISHNTISGLLPHLTFKFPQYSGIDLSYNNFEGTIPPVAPDVTYLILSNNKFSGSIAFLLCGITGEFFHYLDLSDNQLSGSFPNCSSCWQGLSILNLANNNFSGKIPNSLDFGCCIQSLHLRNNSLVGELPSSLKHCTQMRVMDVGHNKFSGKIPAWIGDSLSDLVVLSLRSNQFHGMLPIPLFNLSRLHVLDLSSNNVTGTIPKCLANLTSMSRKGSSNDATITILPIMRRKDFWYQDHAMLVWKGVDSLYKNTLGLVKSIDLSSNKLFGEIPKAITSLVGLISLNLSRNTLTGPIPPQLGLFSSLNSLDLSKNQLTGEIPESFSELDSLGVLDLSNNRLSGKIPTSTKLQSFDAPAYMGNPQLCGSPLQKKCPEKEPAVHESPTIPLHDDKEGFAFEGLYVSIFLGFFTGFWGVCGTLMLNRSWRMAYFNFLNEMKDRLYVFVAVNKANLQRQLGSC